MKYTKDEIVEKLKTGIYIVTFTKVDGEQRVMPCTLHETHTPLVESKGTKKANDNIVNVWCIDKQDWRSFRVDSVTDIAEAFFGKF